MRTTRNIRKIFFLVGTVWGMGACTHLNEEELYGQPDCEPGPVSYNLSVRPILQQHCYSCHATSIATGNVILDNYAGVKKEMDSGRLLGSVRHLPGHRPMPDMGPKLSDCEIARLIQWSEAGAPNN